MFIVTKEIDSENISKLCRTCLREDGDKMVCLFVGPAGSSLAAKLRSLSCLEVWQGDGLPEKMCDRCVTRAESALLYREQCRAADRALRQALLKVSGLGSYAGCKLYQQNQGFVPVTNYSHKTLKCIDCGAIFGNYQELCAHSRLHLPFVQDDIPMQHMHIVESQNPYFNLNLGHLSSNLANENVQHSELSPLIRSNMMQMIPANTNVENPNRAACALHCSLCNRTFTNRTQLISHSIAHRTENVSVPCDNENIDICDNSNQIPQNLSYERSINSVGNSSQNLSYHRSAANDNNEMQSLGFPENMDLGEDVREGSPHRMQNAMTDSETYNLTNCRAIRFAKSLERADSEENISDRYRSNPNYKSSTENEEEPRRYKCDACSKLFSQKSKLLTHKLSHSGQQPFKCPNCEKAYSSKSKLNAHTRLHTKTNVHPCKLCDKVFAYPSYLREHLKTHKRTGGGSDEGKSFECFSCKKRFRLSKNLKAHERLHTGKGLVRCDVCDKTFSQNYNLKIHLRTHKAARPHKCEYCNKCFVQKGNLAEHLRIHTKVKPFECKVCGKRFSQSSHLKNHQASHATVRQHQCPLCGKRFKLANHLKRHLILHNGTKSYKCDQCDQLFSQAFSLTRHLKRHESHA
ncbi:zinc finger protein 2 homolog [Ceratina calcarata]|uniref:Zinc finger protein 2 homolog n=1 Tax=Ceratina calcarata TaxID=156304 RepID=A0AAJ7JBN6_9HYME|nr:zinc finger protein 2 homolog [Ceratina calcarata]